MRLTNKAHSGKECVFHAFNGTLYVARIERIRRQVATVLYHIPGFGEVTTYLEPEYHNRIRLPD